MALRRSGLSTITKRHGWLKPTEGARQAIWTRRSSATPGSGYVATPQKQVEQCGSEVCAEFWTMDHAVSARFLESPASRVPQPPRRSNFKLTERPDVRGRVSCGRDDVHDPHRGSECPEDDRGLHHDP